ncbi:MAG: DUF2752 domain-containing protein [Dysgonamonadaceae bacterium]|nr:DUF2752 domain-containing protein [Dysgonamonadaceae bacterium]
MALLNTKNKSVKIIISVIVILLLMAGLVIFYVFDPETHTFFPQCMFFVFTGFECPGCGTQRAIHSLLHLDFRKAFSYNALMPFLVPYILMGAYLAFLGGRERFPRLENILFGKWAAVIVVSCIVLYGVVRNL